MGREGAICARPNNQTYRLRICLNLSPAAELIVKYLLDDWLFAVTLFSATFSKCVGSKIMSDCLRLDSLLTKD